MIWPTWQSFHSSLLKIWFFIFIKIQVGNNQNFISGNTKISCGSGSSRSRSTWIVSFADICRSPSMIGSFTSPANVTSRIANATSRFPSKSLRRRHRRRWFQFHSTKHPHQPRVSSLRCFRRQNWWKSRRNSTTNSIRSSTRKRCMRSSPRTRRSGSARTAASPVSRSARGRLISCPRSTAGTNTSSTRTRESRRTSWSASTRTASCGRRRRSATSSLRTASCSTANAATAGCRTSFSWKCTWAAISTRWTTRSPRCPSPIHCRSRATSSCSTLNPRRTATALETGAASSTCSTGTRRHRRKRSCRDRTRWNMSGSWWSEPRLNSSRGFPSTPSTCRTSRTRINSNPTIFRCRSRRRSHSRGFHPGPTSTFQIIKLNTKMK